MMTQSQMATSKNLVFFGTLSHKYIEMPIPKTKLKIFIMQPNDVMTGCKVFRMPFQMAYQIGLVVPGRL